MSIVKERKLPPSMPKVPKKMMASLSPAMASAIRAKATKVIGK